MDGSRGRDGGGVGGHQDGVNVVRHRPVVDPGGLPDGVRRYVPVVWVMTVYVLGGGMVVVVVVVGGVV